MPITYENFPEEDEPYNNLKNSEILLEAIKDTNPNSIVICDSHYLDLAGVFELICFCIA